MTEFIETGRGIAHAWLCDGMGHMSSRHFAPLFDDAGYHLMASLGQNPNDHAGGIGWADVRIVDEFKREVTAGTLLIVRSRVVRSGRTSITVEHELAGVPDGKLRATREATIVCFDLVARSARPLPEELSALLRKKLSAL